MDNSLSTIPTTNFPPTIPATQLKNKLGTVIRSTIKNRSELIVSSRGVPQVVIMPFDEWQKFSALRKEQKEQAERQKAWKTFKQLRRDVQAQNPNLTEKQAQELANRFSKDVIKSVIKKRKQKYGESSF